jgi:hypothetical protein
MAALDKRNWYLPAWLAWLPRLDLEDAAVRNQDIALGPERMDRAAVS